MFSHYFFHNFCRLISLYIRPRSHHILPTYHILDRTLHHRSALRSIPDDWVVSCQHAKRPHLIPGRWTKHNPPQFHQLAVRAEARYPPRILPNRLPCHIAPGSFASHARYHTRRALKHYHEHHLVLYCYYDVYDQYIDRLPKPLPHSEVIPTFRQNLPSNEMCRRVVAGWLVP